MAPRRSKVCTTATEQNTRLRERYDLNTRLTNAVGLTDGNERLKAVIGFEWCPQFYNIRISFRRHAKTSLLLEIKGKLLHSISFT